MKNNLFAGASVGIILLASATAASAQSIDYGAMEQLFNEPVTTSATGSPQRSSQAPVDMTIISAADIKRSGATDIPTIVSRAAGVDILAFAAGAAELSVRGYNQARSPRMLVLINGRQVYLDHFGYTDWATLPIALEEIRQIELVRGPNSALFGFNAVSGVINIITYNPKYDDTNSITLQAGTLGYASGNIIKTVAVGPVKARVSVGAHQQDEWSNAGSSVPLPLLSDPWKIYAAFDAVTELSSKTDLRIEGNWSNSGQTEMLSGYNYVPHKVKTDSIKATLISDTPYGAMEAQFYLNQLDSTALPLRYENNIWVAKVQNLVKIGSDHTLRVALEYRDNEVNTTPVRGGMVRYKVLAPSAMWNWAATDKITLTAAARLDSLKLSRIGVFPAGVRLTSNSDWDQSIKEVSVNLGAVVLLSDEGTLRLLAARGVQAPTLVELGSRQVLPTTAPPIGIATLGNPELQPAIITSYEAAYEHALTKLDARVAVKLMVQTTEDVKSGVSRLQIDVPATATTYAALTYFNIGKSEMKGFEVSGSGKFGDGFRWNADTTYVDITDTTLPGYSAVRRLIAFGDSSPKWRSNLGLGWANSSWTVDGYVKRVSKFNSYTSTQTLEPVKGYTTVAGRVAYDLKSGITLALNGQNLMRESQAQTKGISGLRAERRVIFGVTKSW